MIIFDLDGTLALCEHRRHFVDPRLNPDYAQAIRGEGRLSKMFFVHKETKETWKPDWEAFYEACDKDEPNEPIIRLFGVMEQYSCCQIWSGRSESVREKTIDWLINHVLGFNATVELRMRPIGNSTPDDQLKESWLDDLYEDTKWGRRHPVEMTFDDRDKVVAMWRRRGITCCQVAPGDF